MLLATLWVLGPRAAVRFLKFSTSLFAFNTQIAAWRVHVICGLREDSLLLLRSLVQEFARVAALGGSAQPCASLQLYVITR